MQGSSTSDNTTRIDSPRSPTKVLLKAVSTYDLYAGSPPKHHGVRNRRNSDETDQILLEDKGLTIVRSPKSPKAYLFSRSEHNLPLTSTQISRINLNDTEPVLFKFEEETEEEKDARKTSGRTVTFKDDTLELKASPEKKQKEENPKKLKKQSAPLFNSSHNLGFSGLDPFRLMSTFAREKKEDTLEDSNSKENARLKKTKKSKSKEKVVSNNSDDVLQESGSRKFFIPKKRHEKDRAATLMQSPKDKEDFIHKPIILNTAPQSQAFTSTTATRSSEMMFSLFFFNQGDVPTPSEEVHEKGNSSSRKSIVFDYYEHLEDVEDDANYLLKIQKEERERGVNKRVPKFGTLERLIEWIATENQDPKIVDEFLLGYRALPITAYQICKCIQSIIVSIPELFVPPSMLLETKESADEIRSWNRKKLVDFMVKVIYNCSFQELYEEITDEKLLIDHILEFAQHSDIFAASGSSFSPLLSVRKRTSVKSINKKSPISSYYSDKDFRDPDPSASLSGSPWTSPTTSRLRKLTKVVPTKVMNFSQFPLDEIAGHLHLLDFNMFEKIVVQYECIKARWMGDDKKVKAPGVVALTERFNRVSYWVATEIVTAIGNRNQMGMLKKFIIIAEQCRLRNNFHGLMEILAGINMCPVSRLRQAWDILGEKYVDILKDLDELMSSKNNFKNYRAALVDAMKKLTSEDPPILPYFGIYLRDITFLDEGNPDFLENGLLNFEKLRMVGAKLSEIRQFQSQPNPVLRGGEDLLISNFLLNLIVMDDETLFERTSTGKSNVRKSLVF